MQLGTSNLQYKLFYFSASHYEVRFAGQIQDLEDSWSGAGQVDEDMIHEGSLDPLDSGEAMSITLRLLDYPTTVFFAVKAIDKVNNTSPISNIASLLQESGLSGGAIAGIVIGTLLAIFLVVVAAYLVIQRRKSS
jgi:hypothetical protein